MSDIILSVVIPTYNRKDLLEKCLGSLFNQTCQKESYEIVIVDDGSEDGTEELLEDMRAKHDNLNYLRQENKGMFPAWNTGVSLARGQIIVFMDSDCFVPDNFLESIMESFKDHPDMVACMWNMIPIFRNKLFSPLSEYYKSVYKKHSDKDRVFSKLNPFMVFGSDCSAMKKSVFLAIGGFPLDEKFMRFKGGVSADSALGYKMVAAGYKIHLAGKIYGYHNQRDTIRKLIKRHYAFGCMAAVSFRDYFRGHFIISLPSDKYIWMSGTPFTLLFRVDTFKVLCLIALVLAVFPGAGIILLILYLLQGYISIKKYGGNLSTLLLYKLYRFIISGSCFFGSISGSVLNGIVYL